MKTKQWLFGLSSPGTYLPGLLLLWLLLVLSACGSNKSVRIYDNAGVLDSSRVQKAASDLSKPLAIYTTNTFQGNQGDFQRMAVQKLNGNSDMLVMAIDTRHRYLYIARGANVPLSSTGINQAVNAFSGRFNNGDYTDASLAALASLQNSLSVNTQSRGSFSLNPLILCLVLPLLLILFVGLFAMYKRKQLPGMGQSNGFWGGTRGPQSGEGISYTPPGQNYDPYNQGYGPPDQNYAPPNQPRSGMNPWLAGGLGAAAGGLAGYALGRREEDRETEHNNDAGGGGGNFGNDAGGGGSFGNDAAGGGGDFGGGNFGGGDVGGGGDF